MHRQFTRLTCTILLACMSAACGGISDPMSLLPISEQAYLKTIVPVMPVEVAPLTVEAMLQNALVQQDLTTGKTAEDGAIFQAAPQPLTLYMGDGCTAELDGGNLILIGEFRSQLEGDVAYSGLINVSAGDAFTSLCAFQQAGEVVQLLDGALEDIVIEPDELLEPGELRIFVETVE